MSLLLLLTEAGTPVPPSATVLGRGWSVVLLTDLSGEPVGELTNTYDRQISFRLNRATTAQFRVRLDDPLADVLLEGRVLIKLYEGQALRFVGDIVSAEETGTEQQKQIAVVCSSPFWRLEHRLIGKSSTGFEVTTPTDRGTIAQQIHTAISAEWPTAYRNFTVASSSSDTVGPWYYKPASEAFAEMSAALDGFDWREAFIEPVTVGAAVQIADFEVLPFIGVNQPEAIFEYGTGRHNVREYRRAVSKQGLLNHGYSLPTGFPDTAQGAVQDNQDTVSQSDWGLHEGVIASDLVVDELRLKLVQEHVRIRAQPRQVVTFTPVREDTEGGPPVPKFKQDYDIGDTVRFRAQVEGETRLDGVFRVYGVDLSIDEQGAEQPSVQVVPGE